MNQSRAAWPEALVAEVDVGAAPAPRLLLDVRFAHEDVVAGERSGALTNGTILVLTASLTSCRRLAEHRKPGEAFGLASELVMRHPRSSSSTMLRVVPLG
jgi:hypothetical protein